MVDKVEAVVMPPGLQQRIREYAGQQQVLQNRIAELIDTALEALGKSGRVRNYNLQTGTVTVEVEVAQASLHGVATEVPKASSDGAAVEEKAAQEVVAASRSRKR